MGIGIIHDVYDADTRFKINPITRMIQNESLRKTTLIQYDHNSERFSFEIDRYVEGHDMSLCTSIEIHYNNISSATKEENKGLYEVQDMEISKEDEEKVVFSWLISEQATHYEGKLAFAIKFKCETDGVVVYRWDSAINQEISIGKGIENGNEIAEKYADVLVRWELELFGAEDSAIKNIESKGRSTMDEVTNHCENTYDSFTKDVSRKMGEMNQYASETLGKYIEDVDHVEPLEAKMVTLEARMDEFTKLEEGSTTGDAELGDARVDKDGRIHTNVGEHIRNVTGNLAEQIVTQYLNFKYSDFKNGQINWKGEESTTSKRIMFTQPKIFDYPITLHLVDSTTYRYMVHYFNNGVWTQWVNNEWYDDDFIVPSNQEFNVVIARVDDGVATLEELYDKLTYASRILSDVEDHERVLNSFNNYIQTSAYRVYPNFNMIRGKDFASDGKSIINNTSCAINDGFIDIRNVGRVFIPSVDNIKFRILYYDEPTLESFVYDKYYGISDVMDIDVTKYKYMKFRIGSADGSTLTLKWLNQIMNDLIMEFTNIVNPHSNNERIVALEQVTAPLTKTSITGYKDEEDALFKKVRENIDSKTLVFGCITDNHYNELKEKGITAVERAEEFRLICEKIGCDFITQLGDIIDEDESENYDTSINIERVDKMVGALKGYIPFVYAIGHHECRPGVGNINNESLYAVTQSQMYGLTSRFMNHLNVVHYSKASDSNSYYFDVDDRKVRVIVLDSISYGQLGFTNGVLEFLDEALEDTKGYGVIILTHTATRKEMIDNKYTVGKGDLVETKLNNFATNGGKILAYIHGHTHFDNVVKEADMNYTSISVCCSKPIGQTIAEGVLGNPQNYERTIGTYSEHCFDIVCVHTDTNVINLYRFGAGNDRTVEV